LIEVDWLNKELHWFEEEIIWGSSLIEKKDNWDEVEYCEEFDDNECIELDLVIESFPYEGGGDILGGLHVVEGLGEIEEQLFENSEPDVQSTESDVRDGLSDELLIITSDSFCEL
jgi:hypothetical protein